MKQRGFTLIELLVAIFIFSFLSGITANFVIVSIGAQRNAFARQILSDQMSYAMEYVSRALRQAVKELDNPPQCLGRYGANYETGADGQSIAFVSQRGQQEICREFILENGALKERVAEGPAISLTPSAIDVTNISFVVRGGSEDDVLQPRVTFFIAARTKGKKASAQAEILLQTTISQRAYDVLQ